MSFKTVSGGGPEAPGPLPWRPDGPPCCQKQKRQCRRPCTKGRSNAFVPLHFIQKHVTRGSVTVVGVLHGSSLFQYIQSVYEMDYNRTLPFCAKAKKRHNLPF